MRFSPAETDADTQPPDFGVLIDPARVARHVKPGDAEASAGPGNFHQRVQYGRGRLPLRFRAVASRFKPHTINGAIHFRHADDLFNLFGERSAL